MSGEESFVIVKQEMSITNDTPMSTDSTTANICEISNDVASFEYNDIDTTINSNDDTATKPNDQISTNDSTSTNEIVELKNNHQADSTIKNEEHLALPDFDTSTTTTTVRDETSILTNSFIDEDKFDFIKSSVYAQFPSISMGCAEDVVKLQNLLSEYAELKKTLNKTNLTMKMLYDDARKWKLSLLEREDRAKNEIAKLYNENHELRRQLDVQNRIESINTNDEAVHEKTNECIQCLPDNYRQVENCRPQVQDLQHRQLTPTEPNECVSILEHQLIIRQLESKISTITAKNIELNDMQKDTKDNIKLLQSLAEEKSQRLIEVEKQLKESLSENDMMREEIANYINDFKAEKDAHENLAKEKDQLLMDLRELLRKNQELVESSQKIAKNHSTQLGTYPQTSNTQRIGVSSTTTPRSTIQNNITKPGNFKCPLCAKTYDNLDVLQIHVNKCLDET